MRSENEINVANAFSPHLGGRYRKDGPWSGEEFREAVLLPALEKAMAAGTSLVVDFDGVSGTPTSFLEETFGGIFRAHPSWKLDDVQRTLVIEATSTPGLSPFLELARQYMVRSYSRVTA